jgi:hypothetical protein
VKLYLVRTRVGRFPEDFTKHLATYLDPVRSEPHLGVWSPRTAGQPIHDFTALAAWMRQDDPSYLRERLQAKREGPIDWQPDAAFGS